MSSSRTAAFLLLILCAAALVLPLKTAQTRLSQGDQFLDGIGETALVARYVLAGNAEDWSRNNHHASVRGAIEQG